MLAMIFACDLNGAIGKDGDLPWRQSSDLRHFKMTTINKTVVMGRKTWDSIGKPLPGRGNIVLTNSKSWKAEGAIVVNSFEDAITRSNQWIEENKLINNLDIKDKIFLFGGAQIYKLGIQYCNVIEITKVIFDTNVGTKFPMLEEEKWNKIKLEHFKKNESYPEFSYWQYRRINKQ